MNLFFYFLFFKILKDTLLPFSPFTILKNPIINTLKLSPDTVKYTLRGETLFLKGVLKAGDTVYIEYESVNIKSLYGLNYLLREKEILEKVENREEKKEGGEEEIYLTGTKEMGFKIEEGNFSIVQSTDLKISGRMGKDMEIEGVFQDQSLPGEGTVSLSELEEAYFRINSPLFAGRMGDFFMEKDGIKRKILGIEGEVKKKDIEFGLATGYGKGSFQTQTINIIPGKEGPYFLDLRDGERIIPGSEKVYLDGKILKRGREYDYFMDYETGAITFTPQVNLTSQSNVRVEFEKVEGGYDKNYILLKGMKESNFLNLNFIYFLESDLKNNPLFYLSERDRGFLKEIGDTSRIIYREGYEYVGEGKGGYIRKGDTLQYVGEGKGDYRAYFVFVGQGKGSYVFNDITGGFEYVGENNGDYLPRRTLYIPQRKNFFILSSDFLRGQEIEIFLSEFDKNTFSNLDENNNVDFGFKASNRIFYKGEGMEGGIKFTSKYLGRNLFFPFRENEPEYEFLWMTSRKERYRLDLVPYFSLEDFFNLSAESGYLKTDSGIVERRMYSFELKKYLEFGEIYEEIKNKTSLSSRKNYRNRIYVKKSFSNFFISFRNFSQNAYLKSMDREISFGFPNLFFTLMENFLFKNRYVFSSSLNLSLKYKSWYSSTGTLKYSFIKPYFKKGFKNYFYNLFSFFNPSPLLKINFNFLKNPDAIFEKNTEYLFVGEGKGNFSYDSISGTFYPDENGSYIRKEFFKVSEGEAFKQEIHSSLNYSGSYVSLLFGFESETKVSQGLPLLQFKRYNSSFYFNQPLYIGLYLTYSTSLNKEYYSLPLSERNFEGSINVKKDIAIFTPEGGLLYRYGLRKRIFEGVEMEDREMKFLSGGYKKLRDIVFRLNLNYGINIKKSPLYFGNILMTRNYIEIIPNIAFSFATFKFEESFNLTFQNVKNPFSNVSISQKEGWRTEWRFSISRSLRKNFDLIFTGYLIKGKRSKLKNSFNLNFIAYF